MEFEAREMPIDPSKGLHMVLATCRQGKERLCRDELIKLLHEFSMNTKRAVNPGVRLGSRKEKMRLKKLWDEISGSFQWIDSPRGLVLVLILNKTLNPIDLVTSIFRKANSTRRPLTRYVIRMVPISRTCLTSTKDIVRTATEIYQRTSNRIPENHSFAVMLKRRFCANIRKTTLVSAVAKVFSKHRVDLKDPDFVIIVEIFGKFSGVSVVSQRNAYSKYCGFSLERLALEKAKRAKRGRTERQNAEKRNGDFDEEPRDTPPKPKRIRAFSVSQSPAPARSPTPQGPAVMSKSSSSSSQQGTYARKRRRDLASESPEPALKSEIVFPPSPKEASRKRNRTSDADPPSKDAMTDS